MSPRIGIVSLAHMHAYGYLTALTRSTSATFVGITDPDGGRAQKAATDHGTRFFENPADLLAQNLDGVIITSENANHRRDLELCVAAGVKNILCEKPIAATIHDAQAMLDLCARSEVNLATAFPCRYSPAFIRLREQVASGVLGQILAIRGTNRGSMPGGWFVDTELSGGGAVIDHTVHVADLNRYLLGSEATEVYAEIGNGFYHQSWEDTGFLNISYSNGVFATLDTSWSRPKTYPTWGDVTMQVVGTGGCADFDMTAQFLLQYDDAANRVHQLGWGSDLDAGMIADFLTLCRGEKPISLATGFDGLMALRVAAAAYESAKAGQPITL